MITFFSLLGLASLVLGIIYVGKMSLSPMEVSGEFIDTIVEVVAGEEVPPTTISKVKLEDLVFDIIKVGGEKTKVVFVIDPDSYETVLVSFENGYFCRTYTSFSELNVYVEDPGGQVGTNEMFFNNCPALLSVVD